MNEGLKVRRRYTRGRIVGSRFSTITIKTGSSEKDVPKVQNNAGEVKNSLSRERRSIMFTIHMVCTPG